jgi:hypothetical protein
VRRLLPLRLHVGCETYGTKRASRSRRRVRVTTAFAAISLTA